MLNKLLPLRNACLALAFSTAIAAPVSAQDIGPEETFNAAKDAMMAGKYGDVIQLLPESYQGDLNGLINKFATKMDADLWGAGTDIFKSLSNIMNDQKEIASKSKYLDMMGDAAKKEMLDSWDNSAKVMKAITESGILDLEALKTAKVDEMLNGPVAGMISELSKMELPNMGEMESLMDGIKDTKVELLSQDGNIAKMKITGPEGNTMEQNMVKVEGRWIPEDMATNWKDGIAEANAGLDQMDFDTPEFAEQKMMAMMGIGMVKGVLSQLEKAKSTEEFDGAIDGLMKLFGGGVPDIQ